MYSGGPPGREGVGGPDPVQVLLASPAPRPADRSPPGPVSLTGRPRPRLLSEQPPETAKIDPSAETSEGVAGQSTSLFDRVADRGQDQILQQLDVLGVHQRAVDQDLLEVEPAGCLDLDCAAAPLPSTIWAAAACWAS